MGADGRLLVAHRLVCPGVLGDLLKLGAHPAGADSGGVDAGARQLPAQRARVAEHERLGGGWAGGRAVVACDIAEAEGGRL